MSEKPRDADASDTAAEICTLRIELLDSDPLIWRELDVPTAITLHVLHDIVQVAMAWDDAHLWEFSIPSRRRGPWAAPSSRLSSKTWLRDVLKSRRTTLDYTYDFGDCWEHRLIFTHVRPAEPGVACPRYLAGEWNAPPEDCRGIPGFYAALDALAARATRSTTTGRIGLATTIRAAWTSGR